MAGPESPDLTAYRVTIGERVETFDRLDIALAYIGSEVSCGATGALSFETVRTNRLRYSAEVEEQEAGR